MADDLPGAYFGAIVRGVTNAAGVKGELAIEMEEVVSLVRRVHALPGRPCGLSIAWLIESSPFIANICV